MRIKYKMFIEKLWYERDIKRFNEIFKEYSDSYDKCIILHFDLWSNTPYKQFKGFKVNNYSVYGIANYEKSFLLDKSPYVGSSKSIQAGRVINLDINVIQYLNKIVHNRKIDNEDEFIDYLKKLKTINLLQIYQQL